MARMDASKIAQIRDYFIREVNQPEQRAMAEKFGVSVPTVNRYSQEEDWPAQREAYWNDIRAKAFELQQEMHINQLVDRNKVHLESWKLLHEQWRYVVLKTEKPIELSHLSQILERVQKGERLALGLDKMEPLSKEEAITAIRELNKHIQASPEDVANLFEGDEDASEED